MIVYEYTMKGNDKPIHYLTPFENMAETKMIPWLVVAEIKSRRITPKCIFMESIKKHGIRQASFSKYAAATASLQSVKHNAFKPELLLITKLKNERA